MAFPHPIDTAYEIVDSRKDLGGVVVNAKPSPVAGSNEMVERVARAYDPELWVNIDLYAGRADHGAAWAKTREHCLRRARAAIAALREPTEPMWGELARQIVFWNRFPRPTGHDLHVHLNHCWHDAVPEWLAKEIPDNDHVPPKGTVAACIFKAMIDGALHE